MKFVYTRKEPQGNKLDQIKFDSDPIRSIKMQYGYADVELFELEEDRTELDRLYYVFARNSEGGRRTRVGLLKMLTVEGVRMRMLEFER